MTGSSQSVSLYLFNILYCHLCPSLCRVGQWACGGTHTSCGWGWGQGAVPRLEERHSGSSQLLLFGCYTVQVKSRAVHEIYPQRPVYCVALNRPSTSVAGLWLMFFYLISRFLCSLFSCCSSADWVMFWPSDPNIDQNSSEAQDLLRCEIVNPLRRSVHVCIGVSVHCSSLSGPGGDLFCTLMSVLKLVLVVKPSKQMWA